MTRHFMRDTPLYQMEQMMMTPPYFKPRGHSLRRSGFRYQAKDVDCEYCMNYSRRNLCPLDQCICLEERIETGALSLEELLRDCLNSKPKMSLWRRLAQLLYQQSLQFFRTDEHRRRWMHWRTRYEVDYVITHCAPSSIVDILGNGGYVHDHLTDFLEEIRERAKFHYWLFGHYHDNRIIDNRFVLLWEQMVQVV